MPPALRLTDVTKSHSGPDGAVNVLRGVSLALGAGETLALTGESGSGKSTLLHICAGLEPFESGQVELGGQDIAGLSDTDLAAARRDRVGLVFQQFNLVPSLTVAQNLSLQARLAGRLDAALLRDLATRLGLDGLLHRYPEQLSGGQQQRVAIGRCLAAKPALVLADEPTGNLDEATGDAVLDLMQDLCAQSGAALFLVTHSTRLAARLSRHLHLRGGLLETVR